MAAKACRAWLVDAQGEREAVHGTELHIERVDGSEEALLQERAHTGMREFGSGDRVSKTEALALIAQRED